MAASQSYVGYVVEQVHRAASRMGIYIMYLFLAFLLVPLIEIGLFIQVGGWIGLWPTLGIVVLTAVLGTWLVRAQGRLAIAQLRQSFEQLNDPTRPLAHGAMILVSGALLLTPGFFTDAVGFALLVPQVRQAVFTYVAGRVRMARFEMGEQRTTDPDIVDVDWEEVKPGSTKKRSGWVDPPDQH